MAPDLEEPHPPENYYLPAKLRQQIKASEQGAEDVGSLMLSIERLAIERLYSTRINHL